MAKFLVMGATGTVGLEVVKDLRASGHNVRAVSRSGKVAVSGTEGVAFDATKGTSAAELFREVDGAFLMSPPGYADQYAVLEPLIAAAKKAGTRHVVLMTAMGVEHAEGSGFRRAERALEASGLGYDLVRPNWFMQNFHQYWVEGIKRSGVLGLPAGNAMLSFVDARDIAASVAALLASGKPRGKGHTITGPEALDHARAAAIIAKAAGRPVRYEDVSPEAFLATLRSAGMPGDYAALLVSLFAPVRDGFAAAVTKDAEALTGRVPRTLTAYAEENASAWRS